MSSDVRVSGKTPSPEDVRALQRQLARLGYRLDVDGKLGSRTLAALRKFRQDKRLAANEHLTPGILLRVSVDAEKVSQ